MFVLVSGRDEKGPPEKAAAYSAWLRYLDALADDADCAVAASLTYRSLPTPARSAWLDALEEDAPRLSVDPFALYAPLLAVEHDSALATRILLAMGDPPEPQGEPSALCGDDRASGSRVCVLIRPAYLDFADLVACRYSVDDGIALAVREPLRHRDSLPSSWDGVDLVPGRLDEVIEDLAHAVLADRRNGRPPPEALAAFADFFGVGGSRQA